jgi:hypothetical protein
MDYKTVRLRLSDDLYRKYKVFCAINNLSMTQQTEHIVREYIKEQSEHIKIININKKE